jgi:outer membrane lipoprotein-sorting protein
MNAHEKTATLTYIAELAVPDLDLWPSIRQQLDERATAADRRHRYSTWRRWTPAGLAAAAVLALIVAAALPLANRVETVSAETLLDHAQATASVVGYHLLMTRQTPAKGNQSITSEVWFAGPDRQRSVEHTLNSAGATIATMEVVFDGPQAWLATTTEGGQPRVIHTTGTTWTRPAENPSPELNLTAVLAKYSQNKQCMTAQLQGEATMANRATYVINVMRRPGQCADTIAVGDYKIGQVHGDTAASPTVGQMQVWLDKQTSLPLRTEVRDTAGTLLDQMQVTSVEYGGAFPSSVFTYTPPAGAVVSTFAGGDGADVKRALDPAPAVTPGKARP